MADLIGVKDRRSLDATGTHVNRGPADLARYGILVEFADAGVFGPHRFSPWVNQRLRCRPPDVATPLTFFLQAAVFQSPSGNLSNLVRVDVH
jgi:hypothetical protein